MRRDVMYSTVITVRRFAFSSRSGSLFSDFCPALPLRAVLPDPSGVGSGLWLYSSTALGLWVWAPGLGGAPRSTSTFLWF